MSYPQITFELRLAFDPQHKLARQTKARVMEWLSAHGIDEFVEGVMDGLDIDNEYTGPNQRDFYQELGGDLLPISVYKYSRELLDDLLAQITRDIPDGLTATIHSMETSEWLEGWKESFKPIETNRFYIYPPWDDKNIPISKISIVVEPGMAFGTGQHATTQVVLRKLESLATSGAPVNQWRLMDVGTGTGILALGAVKLGFKSVAASDIDPDAITAAKNNAVMNHIDLPLWQGSSPVRGVHGHAAFTPPFEVVVANILFVVLQKIIPELAAVTKKDGLLILSGVLFEDAAEMTKLATAQGMQLVDQGALDGWACLTFTKIAGN
jgi:ribosomal protein L11 methyltransferase